MIKLAGHGASKGIAIGPVHFYKKAALQVHRRKVEDIQAEFLRLGAARKESINQLGALYKEALEQVGDQGAQLFEVHQMMLEDEDYCQAIENIITTRHINAEYAVSVTSANFSKMFVTIQS